MRYGGTDVTALQNGIWRGFRNAPAWIVTQKPAAAFFPKCKEAGCEVLVDHPYELRPDGSYAPYFPGTHCVHCHGEAHHRACRTCGRCMDWRVLRRWGSKWGLRGGRRYCSNACRQKAYRKQVRA